MKKSNLNAILNQINQNIGILQMTIADNSEDSEESDENQGNGNLRVKNRELKERLKQKTEENKRLNGAIRALREEIRVLKAKSRADSVEGGKKAWDRSFEGLYNKKIKKYL